VLLIFSKFLHRQLLERWAEHMGKRKIAVIMAVDLEKGDPRKATQMFSPFKKSVYSISASKEFLSFQIMELGESALGIPQLAVVSYSIKACNSRKTCIQVVDSKQSESENQLAIFTAMSVLKYGVGGNDTSDFSECHNFNTVLT